MGIVLTVFLLLFCSIFAMGQQKAAGKAVEDLDEKRPATISLLSSYYGQDGVHGAVNGGTGSQELKSYSQEGSVYVPVRDSSAIRIHAGVDHFTSASLRVIDKYMTSASAANGDVSGKETRVYGNAGVDIASKGGRTLHSPMLGFSTEYDVRSMNAGYTLTRYYPEKNMSYQIGGTFVADRWLVIYPGEFRDQVMGHVYVGGAANGNGSYTGSGGNSGGGSGSGYKTTGSGSQSGSGGGSHTSGASEQTGSWVDTGYTTGASTDTASWAEVPVGYAKPIEMSGKTAMKNGKTFPIDHRYSWAVTNSLTYVINERMSGMAGIDIMGQWGLLSTPFYRVYFNDGVTTALDKQVDIERLPRERMKVAVYSRYNYQFTNRTGLRLWARLYKDTWDVKAVSASVEVPVKLTGALSVNPMYRVHVQGGSKYFKAYGQHVITDDFYTSDYDLSGFTAHKLGATLRLSPLTPLFSLYNKAALPIFAMSSIGIRYAYYFRSDGLTAQAASLEMSFNL